MIEHYPGLINYGLIFQHDNAPAHRSEVVTDWLNGIGIDVLRWAAQSPDLNIIEHVWAYVKKRLRGRRFTNCDELWEEVRNIWYKIPDDYIMTLYKSMPNRIKELIKQKGGSTKY